MSRLLIGVDAGGYSVGLAAFQVDEDGMPVKIDRLLTVIHDGGKDGMASGSTGLVSRKASGGVARRVRRLLRNRRRRGLKLEQKLLELGYPVAPRDQSMTYEPWRARIDLLKGFIDDFELRQELLSMAIRHMSNHRGWANAWVDFDRYLKNKELEASKEFGVAVEKLLASDFFKLFKSEQFRFQADIAEISLRPDIVLRPRGESEKRNTLNEKRKTLNTFNTIGTQRRVDVAREWREICRVQKVSYDDYFDLGHIAFHQAKPTVPLANVGNDWLPKFKDKKRATVASLEHQEFQVRQTIANLSIRESRTDRSPRQLTVDEQNLVFDHLSGIVDREKIPTWKEIAEDLLDVNPYLLVHSDQEKSLGGLAPALRSVIAIHILGKKHPIIQWWLTASLELRSDLVLWLADPTKAPVSEESEAEFENIVEQFADNDKFSDEFAKLKFPSGRSGHSLEALRIMNAEMAKTGDRYVTVRNRLFNNGEDMRPTDIVSLDTGADHPTIQRVVPIVRKFILGIERQVMMSAERVVIEHVRDAFMGFEAKKTAASEMGKNRKSREAVVKSITEAGVVGPSGDVTDSVIKKFQAIERQGSECLYCGWSALESEAWGMFELDHIVPRVSGGNSTRGNLVAVCRPCNAEKGKLPFAAFASKSVRSGVSVAEAITRAKKINDPALKGKPLFRLRAEIVRRLSQTELDDAIDERQLASTAYAAADLVRRVNTHYGDDPANGRAKVYSGRVVSMARRASGIDKRITIRDGVDVKSRFDRRHHAIDAAVAAYLNPSVSRTLVERDDLYQAGKYTGHEFDSDGVKLYKKYQGSSLEAVKKFQLWIKGMQILAELVEIELKQDRVVVMQPLRVSPSHAALHQAGRDPHAVKQLGEAWTSKERSLIVDDRVYSSVSAGVAPSVDLPVDPAREAVLPNGLKLRAEGEVFLFPDSKSRIALPNRSSSPLGASLHHVRLFRWVNKEGRVQAGVVRVFSSDLYSLVGGLKSDLLTSELPENSAAVRRSKSDLRDAIWYRSAELVGAFVVGDEILIDPIEWTASDQLGQFLVEYPERHWRLDGWPEIRLAGIRPVMLASEGIADDGSTDRRTVVVSDNAKKIIGKGLPITASRIWTTKETMVIRRSGTGAIRGSSGSNGLNSWSPFRAVFGD